MLEQVVTVLATLIASVLVVGIPVFIVKLIQAPVRLKYEKEREPQLTVQKDISLCNHKLGYSWRLKIKNNGIDVAENCRGQLIEIVDEVPAPNWGWQRWPKNEFLSWANGDIATRIQSKQTMELEILYGGGGLGNPLYLAYARDETFRQDNAPKILRGNILLVIMITYDGKTTPIFVVCLFRKDWIWTKSNGLELKAITLEHPDITLYQKQVEDNGDSQT